MKHIFKNIVYSFLVVLVSTAVTVAVVKAGSLTPSTSPTATGYTLADIYTRLTTNATAVAGNFSMSPTTSPGSTLYTLEQIYDAIPTIMANTVKLGTTYLGVSGTLVPSGGTATTANVLSASTFYGATQTDWNLQTGTMTNVGVQTITPTTTNQTITQGYHNGSGYCAGDANLVAGNIKIGTSIFGVTGSLTSVSLSPMNNGTAHSSILPTGVYTSALGGVDDYNNGNTMPSDSYKSTWVACHAGTSPNDAGNNWCGTNDATNADKIDTNTGLVWSKWLDSGIAHTWFWANNCYNPGTAQNPGACSVNGDTACQCVKLPAGSMTGCDAQTGWRLPNQKELMQAYINGSYGNLSSANSYFWSSTTISSYTYYAWYVYLSNGNTNYYNKSNTTRVRCVR